jgi:DNA-binding CsgD family transcriptional regulator
VIGLLDLDELSQGLLGALREAIPAEWCALHEVPAHLPNAIAMTDPPASAESLAGFARYGSQNPLVDYFLRTRDGRAMRFSDLITRRELHRLDLYREVYKPLGAEYQIAITLTSGSDRVLGIALSRAKRDFTARERDLLNLVRPYLIQAYRNALAHSALQRSSAPLVAPAALQALGLTRRQAEVLSLVAMGQSNEAAAATLGIGIRTAEKHLERCYRTLGVFNRSQASRLAWLVARSPARAGAPLSEHEPARAHAS